MAHTKTIEVLVIPVTGEITHRTVKSSLNSMRRILGGAWLEAIGGMSWSAYLDEEGKIKGLPVNERATQLAQVLGWVGFGGDVLVGPVVFCGSPDADGYDTDINPRLLALAKTMFDPTSMSEATESIDTAEASYIEESSP